MQLKLGFEAKLFIGAAGVTPTTEAKNVKDVTINLESSEVDASSRQSGKFKIYLAGMIDAGIEFKMNVDADDPVLSTIRAAWLARNAIAVKVELGDGMAFDTDAIVTNFTNEQAQEDVISYSVTLKPTMTSTDRPPQIISAV